MKTQFLICTILMMMLFVSCKDDDSNPAGAEQTTYELSDIVGSWTGTVENSYNTLNLNLTVDSDGKVSGSGVSSTWSIDSDGKITGGGSFSFIAGSSLIIASSSWSAQLNSNKTKISGTFNVGYSTLHDMAVDLTKD